MIIVRNLKLGSCRSCSGLSKDEYDNNEAISELSPIHVARIFRPVECSLFLMSHVIVTEYGILPLYEVGARLLLNLSLPNPADDTLVEKDWMGEHDLRPF